MHEIPSPFRRVTDLTRGPGHSATKDEPRREAHGNLAPMRRYEE